MPEPNPTVPLLTPRSLILGICGSIAAYRAVELGRLLEKRGWCVTVVLSEGAERFVSRTTLAGLFGGRVYGDADDDGTDGSIVHIRLAKEADVVLIAPASANSLADYAQGRARGLLGSLLLATRAPVWIAPAMNQAMWTHGLTQANVTRLACHGVRWIGPVAGLQACGDEGPGRMVDALEIATMVDHALAPQDLLGHRVVITGGATREWLDPVRFISNASSGKMALALAYAAHARGASVTLIAGVLTVPVPTVFPVIKADSAASMEASVMKTLPNADSFWSAAAVCDMRPLIYAEEKRKRDGHGFSTLWEENPDIVAAAKRAYPACFCVAFSAETDSERGLSYARKKHREKAVDAMIFNAVGRSLGFDEDDHAAAFLAHPDAQPHWLPRQSKASLAHALWDCVKNKSNF